MQPRENNNNNSQPVGICQRLFNFIMNTLLAGGLKRLTNPLSPESNEVPVEGPSVPRVEPGYHPEYSSSEITVEFGHTNGVKHQAPNRVSNEERALASGKGEIFRTEESGITPSSKKKIESEVQVNGHEYLDDPNSTAGSRGKSTKKTLNIKGSGGEREKHEITDTKTTATAKEAEDTTVRPMAIKFLDTNKINEKADDFIRRTREALSRTNTLEPP